MKLLLPEPKPLKRPLGTLLVCVFYCASPCLSHHLCLFGLCWLSTHRPQDEKTFDNLSDAQRHSVVFDAVRFILLRGKSHYALSSWWMLCPTHLGPSLPSFHHPFLPHHTTPHHRISSGAHFKEESKWWSSQEIWQRHGEADCQSSCWVSQQNIWL